MHNRADAVHRGRDGQTRAEHRNRRACQIEVEQHARADEEGTREEFADLFPIDGHAVVRAISSQRQDANSEWRIANGVFPFATHHSPFALYAFACLPTNATMRSNMSPDC